MDGGDVASMAAEEEPPPPARPPVACCACGEPAKYRCPACDTRSCSAACVDSHKQNRPCTGKRNVAEYHAIGEFDDLVVHRDYQFLEDVGRAVDSSKRVRRDVEPAEGRRGYSLPPARHQLLQRALERGVQLELLPHGMQRQRENTSRYDARRRLICWRVELDFGVAGVRHIMPSVVDSTTLRELLRDLIGLSGEPSGSTGAAHAGKSASASNGGGGGGVAAAGDASTNPGKATAPAAAPAAPSHRRDGGQRAVLRHKLRAYAAAGEELLVVFMAVPHRRGAADERFYSLPLVATLLDALHGKTLIEFPTLHVAIRDGTEKQRFPTIMG